VISVKLNQIFQSAIPTKQPRHTTTHGGSIRLFRRPDSQHWQCRFRLDNGTWHQATTGTTVFAEAETRAIAIYETIRVRVSNDLAIRTKSFQRVALEEVEALRHARSGRLTKQTTGDYIFVIERYLIPFFGRYHFTELTQDLVNEFACWRISEMGREPKYHTQRHHASAFNRVLQRAKTQGLITFGMSVPTMRVVGDRGEARPSFSQQEIDYLLGFMPTWVDQTRLGRTKRFYEMKMLCWHYVKFLLYTGIRAGTESKNIRWRNLQWHHAEGRRYLRIWVSGKTGPRYLIARDALIASLERLMAWQGYEYASLAEMIGAGVDRRIFAMPAGDQPYELSGVFERLMRDSGLLRDAAGKTRTLYSLRHTYATFALADGVPIHTLARQMGTSVGMIERHYSKLTPMLSANRLA
jgi:integrase